MGFPPANEIQLQIWSRWFGPPWEMFAGLLRHLPNHAVIGWTYWFNLGLLGLALWGVAWGLRRLPLALNVYNLATLFFLLSNQELFDPLMSFNRFLLGLFPLFFALAGWMRGRTARLVYLTCALLGMLLVSVLFFMWKWVG
jgi:hypothetical protein